MAYFDSAKNRALWQKELAGLRQERARRESMGFMDEGRKKSGKGEENPNRIRITFAQLEREEYEAVQARKAQKEAARQKSVSAERSETAKVPEAFV